MYWQIPTIQAFQSIVPGSVMEFYKSIGVERSVGSRPKTDVYGIRSFLSCKYLFDNKKQGKKFAMSSSNTQMTGWSLLESKNGYDVYGICGATTKNVDIDYSLNGSHPHFSAQGKFDLPSVKLVDAQIRF